MKNEKIINLFVSSFDVVTENSVAVNAKGILFLWKCLRHKYKQRLSSFQYQWFDFVPQFVIRFRIEIQK